MSAELAYKFLAERALDVFSDENWESIIIKCKIQEKMVSYELQRIYRNEIFGARKGCDINISQSSTEGVLFLRDNLLETTGERIWGLTFTFYNNGEFNIDYNYDKPDIGES